MGHITTDLIEDAWRDLKVADNLIDAGQTYAGVMKCENALKDLYKSTKTVLMRVSGLRAERTMCAQKLPI